MAEILTPEKMSAEELLKYFTGLSQGNKTTSQTIQFLFKVRGNREVNKILKNIADQTDLSQEKVAGLNEVINGIATGTSNKRKPAQLTDPTVLNKILRGSNRQESAAAVREAWYEVQRKSTKNTETELVRAMASHGALFEGGFPYEQFADLGDGFSKWQPSKKGIPNLDSLQKDYRQRFQRVISGLSVLGKEEWGPLFSQLIDTVYPELSRDAIRKAPNKEKFDELNGLRKFIVQDINDYLKEFYTGLNDGSFIDLDLIEFKETEAFKPSNKVKQQLTQAVKENLQSQIESFQFTDQDLNIDSYYSELTSKANLAKEPLKAKGTGKKLQNLIKSIESEQEELLQSLAFANENQSQEDINKIALQYQRNQKAIAKANQQFKDWEKYPEEQARLKAEQAAERARIAEQKAAQREAERIAREQAKRQAAEERAIADRVRLAEKRAEEEAKAQQDAQVVSAQRASEQEMIRNSLAQPITPEKVNEADVVNAINAVGEAKEKEASARRDNAQAAEEERKATQQANSAQPQTAWADTLLTKLGQIHEILRDLVGTFQQLNTAFGSVDEKSGIGNLLTQLQGISEALGPELEKKLKNVNVQMNQIVQPTIKTNQKLSDQAISKLQGSTAQELNVLNEQLFAHITQQWSKVRPQYEMDSPERTAIASIINSYMRESAPRSNSSSFNKLEFQTKRFLEFTEAAKTAGIDISNFENRYARMMSELDQSETNEANKPVEEIEKVLNPQKTSGLEAYVSQLDQIIDRLQTIANLVSTSMGLGQIFGKDENGNTIKKDVDYSKATVPEVKTDAKNESGQFGDLEAKLQHITELLRSKNELLQEEFDLVSNRLGGETSAFQPLIDQLQTIDGLLASIVPNLQVFVNSQDAIGNATAINNNQQTRNTNNNQSNSRSSSNSNSTSGAGNNNTSNGAGGPNNIPTNINNPTINIDTKVPDNLSWINDLLQNADPLRQKELLSHPNSSVLYRTKPHQTMNVQYQPDAQGNPVPVAASLTTDFKALAAEMISVDAELQKLTNDYANLSNSEAQTQGPILLQRIAERRARQLELETERNQYLQSPNYALRQGAQVVEKDVQDAHNRTAWDLSLKNQKRTDKDKNIDAYNDVKTALDKVIAATKTLRTLEAEQKSGKNPWRDYAAEIQLAEKALSSYNTDLERAMQQRYGWQNTADSQAVLTQISAEDRLSQNQKKRLSSLVETKDSETTNLNQSRLDVLIPKWDGLSKAVNNYLKAISNVNKASDVKGMTSLADDIDNAKQGFDDIFTVLEKRYPHLQATLNSIRQTVSQELNDQMNSASGNILESLQSRNLNIQNVLGNSVNGQLKMGSFGPEIANLQNLDLQIKKLTDDLNQGKISWSTYLSGIQNINSQIAPMEKAGGIIANIQKQIESYGNDQRSMGWSDRMKQISAAMRELFDVRGDAKQFEQKRVALLDMMKGLKAYSNATLMQNKQGFLVGEGTINQISDMEASMRKFAEATNIGSVASVKWSADNQKVTMTCKKASGQITTLTGSMEKLANAYRLTTNVSKAPSAFLTGFTGSIGQTIKQLPRLMMGYDAVMKVRSELTAGMSTFKEYDSTLTNISYTMNMTSKELDALGKSAIDMAKDLSMSVANAEDVYKIYANMNTSAEEIQQLAKPTVILSNLSGVDASTAADEVQGIIQQFDMLKDSEADAADVSMHVVDVLNDISANVAMDYSFN